MKFLIKNLPMYRTQNLYFNLIKKIVLKNKINKIIKNSANPKRVTNINQNLKFKKLNLNNNQNLM